MSHPPETSLSSRELAEQIHDLWMNKEWEDINPYVAAAALIDAWVRVRIAEDRWYQHGLQYSSCHACTLCNRLIGDLATARKQLEETP